MKRENADTVQQLLKSVFKSSKENRLNERRFWKVVRNLPEGLTPRDVDEGLTISAWHQASREVHREQALTRRILLSSLIIIIVGVLVYLGLTYVPGMVATMRENRAQTQTQQALLSASPTMTYTAEPTATLPPTATAEPTQTPEPTQTSTSTATPLPQYFNDSNQNLPEDLSAKIENYYFVPGTAFEQKEQESSTDENEDNLTTDDPGPSTYTYQFSDPVEPGFYQVYANDLTGSGTLDVGTGLVHRGVFSWNDPTDSSENPSEGSSTWDYIGTYYIPENQAGSLAIEIVIDQPFIDPAEFLIGKLVGPQAKILRMVSELFGDEIKNNRAADPEFVLLDFSEDRDSILIYRENHDELDDHAERTTAFWGNTLVYDFVESDGWLEIERRFFQTGDENTYVYDVYLFDQTYSSTDMLWAKQENAFKWFSVGIILPEELGGQPAEQILLEGNFFVPILKNLPQDEIDNNNDGTEKPNRLRLINFEIATSGQEDGPKQIAFDFLIIVKRPVTTNGVN